ncbi:hypothetical protein SLEP1_g32032 [Rubroshorea leprosula]|uniref:Pectinesterase inhibitor domain-containing protein n=1 Tax=Rubroshorea leprosula TaxID=152421 RepID=A0AAV5KC97_9ROSI|nr:hypothetical protein SLEP1_g32032 [Rubroshorea leprosula]
MKFSIDFSLLFPLAFCLSFLPLLNAADANATAKLIEKACKDAEYKDLCIQSLQADEASKDSDLRGLVLLAIRLAGANGSDTLDYIKKIQNDTSESEPAIDQCLNECWEHYLSAVEQLDDSIAALLAEASNDVKTWVEAAIIDAESCEDALKEYPGKQSVILERSTIFRRLCSNALAINKVWAKAN